MSQEFIKWTGPYGHNGIYQDTKTKKFSSTVSDLHGKLFDTEAEAEDWINNVYYGDGGLIHETDSF